MIKFFPWLLAYVGVSLPVVAQWYTAKARRLSRSTRLLLSRLKTRFLAALGRRLQRLLSEQSEDDDDENSPPPVPLRPLP